jgi:hypothetical protein
MKKPAVYIEQGLLVIPTYKEIHTEDGLGNVLSSEEKEDSRLVYGIVDGKFILQL